jgi:hypothetical protein
MKELSIIENGKTYNATYTLDDRGVCVASAYGSERAALSRKDDPGDVAKGLLRGLVQGWEPARTGAPIKRRR